MMYKTFMAAIASMAAFSVSAQVEVEDRRIPSSSATTQTVETTPLQNESAAEMYYQLQVLQQEVLQLRGMVEQQAFEIKKLKQQRLDDYLDLDRRVSQLSQGGVSTPANTSTDRQTAVSTPVVSSTVSSKDEMKNYKAAINLVLKEQKYDEAVVALTQHLEEFPKGRFAANAQYWLGEVFLQKGSLDEARQWFSRVVDEHPRHVKVPDAQYKLGVVYHRLGDLAQARSLLERVAQSNANSARLAQQYLDSHFAQ